jgi:hypothetical protein
MFWLGLVCGFIGIIALYAIIVAAFEIGEGRWELEILKLFLTEFLMIVIAAVVIMESVIFVLIEALH